MKKNSPNKIYLAFILLLLTPLTISVAQISGISGAKLCVPDAGTKDQDFAIEENVKNQIAASLSNSKVLKELFESRELQIAGAVYSLKTGIVKLLHTEIEE